MVLENVADNAQVHLRIAAHQHVPESSHPPRPRPAQAADCRIKFPHIIAGAIIGYVVGGSIGRSMDERDRACVGQALEYAEDHETIAWDNPDRNTSYRLSPTNTYTAENGYCREYKRTSVHGGERTHERGKACRQADGQWKIVR